MSATAQLKKARQLAAARGRAERERRIAADRVNHARAAIAFAKWLRQPPAAAEAHR